MQLDAIGVDRDRGIALVRLSGRPLGQREATELIAVCDDIREDRDVRVVVLDSAGTDLCPGAADALDPSAFGPDPAAAVASLRPPVVVACRGVVAGVGLELALAGDVRIAGAGARFLIDDVARGRVPSWGGTQRLPRTIGRSRATSMILLGEELSAGEALTAGLVERVVPDDDIDQAVADVAGRLADLAPLALELAKEAVHRGAEMSMIEALHLEGDLNHLLQTSADRAEGLRAFFDKRGAEFTGR